MRVPLRHRDLAVSRPRLSLAASLRICIELRHLRPIRCVEHLEYLADVVLHGACADPERAPDRLVAHALTQQVANLLLTRRQVIGGCRTWWQASSKGNLWPFRAASIARCMQSLPALLGTKACTFAILMIR